jgi:valyl-tRNA synthetase
VAAEALAAIRKAKSEAKVSMRAPVESAVVHVPEAAVALVEAVRRDLVAAGIITTLTVQPSQGPLTVDVVLAPAE